MVNLKVVPPEPQNCRHVIIICKLFELMENKRVKDRSWSKPRTRRRNQWDRWVEKMRIGPAAALCSCSSRPWFSCGDWGPSNRLVANPAPLEEGCWTLQAAINVVPGQGSPREIWQWLAAWCLEPDSQVLVWALPLTALSKSPNVFVPQFAHLSGRDYNGIYHLW